MCPNIKIYKDLMKNFEELGLSPEIRRAIEEMGYECPMPVQEEVIPYLLGENNDVVALAQTGLGKLRPRHIRKERSVMLILLLKT